VRRAVDHRQRPVQRAKVGSRADDLAPAAERGDAVGHEQEPRLRRRFRHHLPHAREEREIVRRADRLQRFDGVHRSSGGEVERDERNARAAPLSCGETIEEGEERLAVLMQSAAGVVPEHHELARRSDGACGRRGARRGREIPATRRLVAHGEDFGARIGFGPEHAVERAVDELQTIRALVRFIEAVANEAAVGVDADVGRAEELAPAQVEHVVAADQLLVVREPDFLLTVCRDRIDAQLRAVAARPLRQRRVDTPVHRGLVGDPRAFPLDGHGVPQPPVEVQPQSRQFRAGRKREGEVPLHLAIEMVAVGDLVLGPREMPADRRVDANRHQLQRLTLVLAVDRQRRQQRLLRRTGRRHQHEKTEDLERCTDSHDPSLQQHVERARKNEHWQQRSRECW
jgi:hypothetical protein